MMESLKKYQNPEGLWNQLIDQSDCWTETSGSAMFTFAFIKGVKNGWLNAEEYAPAARKAWIALVSYLNDKNQVREICVGTNKKNSKPVSYTHLVHDGSPYKQVNPMQHYENTASPRGSRVDGFNPEYGAPTLPTVEILREMMDEKDLWPINKEVWDYLDGNGFHLMSTMYTDLVNNYGKSSSIDEFAPVSYTHLIKSGLLYMIQKN